MPTRYLIPSSATPNTTPTTAQTSTGISRLAGVAWSVADAAAAAGLRLGSVGSARVTAAGAGAAGRLAGSGVSTRAAAAGGAALAGGAETSGDGTETLRAPVFR